MQELEPQLTAFQALLLFALQQLYSPAASQRGLTYKQLAELLGSSPQMVKKTIWQLRNRKQRSKPLIDSQPDNSVEYGKGRRPDQFFIQPDNITIDQTVAYCVVSLYNLQSPTLSLPKRLSTFRLLTLYSYRAEYSVVEQTKSVDLEMSHAGSYPTLRNQLFKGLQDAHAFGYISTPASRSQAMALTPLALSHLPYLTLLNHEDLVASRWKFLIPKYERQYR